MKRRVSRKDEKKKGAFGVAMRSIKKEEEVERTGRPVARMREKEGLWVGGLDDKKGKKWSGEESRQRGRGKKYYNIVPFKKHKLKQHNNISPNIVQKNCTPIGIKK